MIEQMIQRMLECAGQQLGFKVHREEAQAGVELLLGGNEVPHICWPSLLAKGVLEGQTSSGLSTASLDVLQRKRMRYAAIVAFSMLLGSSVGHAQEWRATFTAERGSRIDYLPKAGGFKQNTDNMSYRYEFVVPASGDIASLRLIPTASNTLPTESYSAFILGRSEEMIVLLLVHAANPRPDKFEVHTLYPKSGAGFSTTTSAYLGNPVMKGLSATDPEIPVATSSIFPLRQIDR